MRTTKQKMHYVTYGDTSAPSIVMIHGFTGSHEGFQYIVPHLSDYHVIVPDLPGFGESPLDIEHYSIDALAARINEFVDELGLETPPYLVSHSMGGLVAASMLAQQPELYARKTVFISPVSTPVGLLDQRKVGEVLGRLQYFVGKSVPSLGPKLVRSKRLSTLATKVIMTTSQPDLRRTIDQHHHDNLNHISSIEYYYQLHKDINNKGAINYAQPIKEFDVLVIAGRRDNVTPLATVQQFVKVVDARLVVIDDVGHLAHYEAPDVIASALVDFLR